MSNYKNLASTVLGNSGQTTDTSIVIPSTTAAIFPTPPFYATIMPTNVGLVNSSNSEIVEVTASTTSGSDTTFTVSRAQRGTSAISWNAHEAILTHAIYTQDMPFIDDVLSTPSSVAYVATDNIQTSAVTTPKIADGAVTSDKIDWTTYDYTDNGLTYHKLGNIVIGSILLAPSSSIAMTNYDANPYLITTLPDKPIEDISVPTFGYNSSNGAVGQYLVVRIGTDGKVYIRNYTSTSVGVSRLMAGFAFIAS